MNRLLPALMFLLGCSAGHSPLRADDGIRPWPANRWYWSVDGRPVMLVGGSDDDNLYQWPHERLIRQLDRIQSAGGNVVRNTMSDRKDGGFEVYPFLQLTDGDSAGKYDLSKWNPEYWRRLETFLAETAKRDIYVQIEVWDRFDYTDNRANDPKRWESHPYNPPNNINYTRQTTGLELRYPEHPGANKQPFFFSTPDQRNLVPLLQVQEAFVDKLLDHTLKYDHLLYCIDNETRAEPEWARHWANFIRSRARRDGQSVCITEMWDDWDLSAARHRQTFDHPELYDFVDVSQNNHNSGQKHWDNLAHVRERLSANPRPMNTTKIYGADGNKFGHSDQDAIERFWRHLLGGAASVRFHRPPSGLGINDRAVACLKAARHLEKLTPYWNLSPAPELLGDRETNEAYAAATDRAELAIFFPKAEPLPDVTLKCGEPNTRWRITWIDIDTGTIHSTVTIRGDSVRPPRAGNFAAFLIRVDD